MVRIYPCDWGKGSDVFAKLEADNVIEKVTLLFGIDTCPSYITDLKFNLAGTDKTVVIAAKPMCCDNTWFEFTEPIPNERFIGKRFIDLVQGEDPIDYPLPPGEIDDPVLEDYLKSGYTKEEAREYHTITDNRGHDKPWSRTETNIYFPVTLTLKDIASDTVDTLVFHRCSSSNGYYEGILDVSIE